jgi:predicted nucleic acid-binding protein
MSYVFDAEPLLAYFLGENGAFKVAELLHQVSRGDIKASISLVNLTEFYYALYRLDEKAPEVAVQRLRAYGMGFVPVDEGDIWRVAAEIKATHRLSLGDAFAASTAKVSGAILVAGSDPELEDLGIELLRIR